VKALDDSDFQPREYFLSFYDNKIKPLEWTEGMYYLVQRLHRT